MPTYEYFCEKCGLEFENFQSISSKPIRICPRCGEKSIHRKISGGTCLIFKGSGFYITDYTDRHSNSISGNGNGHSDKPKSSEKSKDCRSVTEKADTKV